MIQAAFFDIDGTLRSYNTQLVYPGTARALCFLRQQGVKTFVATGRPPLIMPEMPVEFDGYISMTGSFVYSGSTVLHSSPLTPADTAPLFDYAAAHDVCLLSFGRSAIYASRYEARLQQLRNQLNFDNPDILPLDQMRQIESYQMIAIVPSDKDAELKALLPSCFLPRWHPGFVDIVSNRNSKMKAVEAVCRYYGIPLANTLAFGDGGNDIDMLRGCGIGVAMGSAVPEVRQAADMVTATVEEEGIEKAVAQLFSNYNA